MKNFKISILKSPFFEIELGLNIDIMMPNPDALKIYVQYNLFISVSQ